MGTITRLAIPVGCVTFAGLVAGAKSASRRTVFVLAGAVLLSVIPAVHLALIGSSGLGSRILYLPAAVFAPMIGILARPLRYRNVLVAGLAFFVVVITLHNLSAWRSAALLADRVCTQAAESPGRDRASNAPSTRDGVYFFANGFDACVDTKIEMRRR